MKNALQDTSPSAYNWPGKPVDRAVMLEFLQQILQDKMYNNFQHYALATPGVQRPFAAFFKLRLCWFFEFEGKGGLQAAFDGALSRHNITPGDVVITASNAIPDNEGDINIYSGFTIAFHMHLIRLHYVRSVKNSLQNNIYYHTIRPASGVLSHLTDALNVLIHTPGTNRQERCRPIIEAIVRQLYYEVSSEDLPAEKPAWNIARRIKDYLDHNYHRRINCSSTCEALNVNRTYATEVFHKSYQMSMQKYIQSLRLEAAVNMLINEEKIKIKDISFSCGFSSPCYFIKVFREKYGCTPEDFRKRKI